MRSSLPTSHGFVPLPSPTGGPYVNPLPPSADSPFETQFAFTGSSDCTPVLCVPAALAYRDALGGDAAIHAYCTRLARDGGARVAALLGTEVLDNEAATLGRCFFANVRLPLSLAACEAQAQAKGVARDVVQAKVKAWAAEVMVREYGGFQALVEYGGGWWARLSAMVYLEMADFEWGAGVLKKICERVERGEWLDGEGVKKIE